MTNSNYELEMNRASELEEKISRYRAGGDSEGNSELRKNWVSNAQIDFLDFVEAHNALFTIYQRFNQREKATLLLNDLFTFVDSCDDFSYLIGLRLLLVLDNKLNWLANFNDDIKESINTRLEKVIWQTVFSHFDPSFSIIATKRTSESAKRSAFELLRDLATSDDEKARIDYQLCMVMELAANFNIAYRNLPMAEQWLRWAAEIVQDRLADKSMAGRYLEQASQIHRAYTQEPPSEAYVKAVTAKIGTQEYIDAKQQLNFVESLEVILGQNLAKQHNIRFIEQTEQILDEYKTTSNTLEKLATDDRFKLDFTWINQKVNEFGQGGLAYQLPIIDYDARDNPKQHISGEDNIRYRFSLHILHEIIQAITSIIDQGILNGHITSEALIEQLTASNLAYDWTITKIGIERFIANDFVSASHILVTQFENIFREVVKVNQIPTKATVQGTTGDILLNQLTQQVSVRKLMGEEFVETIDWIMTKSYGPFNYRHKIAHGWVKITECNFTLCSLAIWLILKTLSFVPSNSN